MIPRRVTRTFFWILFSALSGFGQVITTVAGGGWRPFPSADIPALSAPLGTVSGPALDGQGNLFVADSFNHVVVRISPSGTLSLIAGNGKAGFGGDGGPATAASLNGPTGVAVDNAGSLFIADRDNHRVRKISNGVITTIAGDGIGRFNGDGLPPLSTSLNHPSGLAFDNAGNLYVADQFNERVRKVSGGVVTTVAGTQALNCSGPCDAYGGDNGPAVQASLADPVAVAFDSANNLYIADRANARVRKVDRNGIITTIAGNGSLGNNADGIPGTSASIYPEGVAVDSTGNLYIADSFTNRVRVLSGVVINTVAGNGVGSYSGDQGQAKAAGLDQPTGVAVDSKGQLFIADSGNERVRKVAGGVISTVAGTGRGSYFGDGGPALSAGMLQPQAMTIDRNGSLYIADTGNHCIRKVSGGVMTTVAGTGVSGFGGDNGPATNALLDSPQAVAVDAAGNLYIADTRNNRIRKVSGGIITTVAGTSNAGYSGEGPATSASLWLPQGLAVDGTALYVSDTYNLRVRKVSNGVISTVAGNGRIGPVADNGPATSASLSFPTGIALDGSGNLYIADTENFRIRKVSSGTITTVAGIGKEGFSPDGTSAIGAYLDTPIGVAVDNAGNLWIAESLNARVRLVSHGVLSTVAGTNRSDFAGDGGLAANASLTNPYGLAVDATGNLYIADTFANRIREVLSAPPTYQVSQLAAPFSTTEGGQTPAPQFIGISSAVSGLAYSATISAAWLTVTPATGTIPAILTVTVDPTGLTAGSYSGTITVATPNAIPAQTTVPVSFNVQTAVTPQLSVVSSPVTFGAIEGGTPQYGQLQVSNSGGGSIQFSVAATTTNGSGWLTVSPSQGVATASTPAAVSITADPSALTAGTYQGVISISGAGTTTNVNVYFSVAAANPVMLLSDKGMTFKATAQGGAPFPQSFSISNTGRGSMDWTATAHTLAGGDWLHISQTSGTVAHANQDQSSVAVSVDPSGLATGDYYGQIRIVSAAANSPQLLTVILSVLKDNSALGPDLQPASLVFYGDAGSTPPPQDVTILATGTTAASYSSSSSGAGFTYLPANGNVLPGQPGILRVFPDFSGMVPGEVEQRSINLDFTDGSKRKISVLLVANPAGGRSTQLAPKGSCSQEPVVNFVHPLPGTKFAAFLGQSIAVDFTATACNQPVDSTDPVAGASASFTGNGSVPKFTYDSVNKVWHGSFAPTNPVPGGDVRIVVYLNSSAGSVQVTAYGTLSSSNTPRFTILAHAASFLDAQPIAPCSLLTIKGENLADGDPLTIDPSQSLPLLLNGTQVFLGDFPLPIRYVSSTQLNLQVPCEAPIRTNDYPIYVIHSAVKSVELGLSVAHANPGIFTTNERGTGQGVIQRPDGSIAGPIEQPDGSIVQAGNAALPGETVSILCTGLGPVTPSVTDGTGAPQSPLSKTVNAVTVTIGGQPATVLSSGLQPQGAPGVYLVNVQVPDGIFGTAIPVSVTVTGYPDPPLTSKEVTMAIQPEQ